MPLSQHALAHKLQETNRQLNRGEFGAPAEREILHGMASLYKTLLRLVPPDAIMNPTSQKLGGVVKEASVEPGRHPISSHSVQSARQCRLVPHDRQRGSKKRGNSDL